MSQPNWRHGAAKRGSIRLSAQLDAILAALPVLPFATPAEQIYGEIRTRPELEGTPIGANDLLIAAHGLALNQIVVTDNERAFARVPGLHIENWLRPVEES
ncbi:MAG: mvpA [Rhizorhabdus sp.]|nr:mvpA [Rhizorhabdus sp.]